jgi:hypothetical protein
VDGCVGWYRLELEQLVGADPQRCAHGWVELANRSTPELVDPVIERANPLDRPVGDSLGQSPVARVEPLGRGAEHPVCVRVVLEHAAYGLEGRSTRRRRGHLTPRRNSS